VLHLVQARVILPLVLAGDVFPLVQAAEVLHLVLAGDVHLLVQEEMCSPWSKQELGFPLCKQELGSELFRQGMVSIMSEPILPSLDRGAGWLYSAILSLRFVCFSLRLVCSVFLSQDGALDPLLPQAGHGAILGGDLLLLLLWPGRKHAHQLGGGAGHNADLQGEHLLLLWLF
jgi:hypothetical protein